MSNQLNYWRKLWQTTHSLGLNDKQQMVRDTDPRMCLFAKMMDDMQSQMNVNNSIPFNILLQFTADEIALYITQTAPAMSYKTINMDIECNLKLTSHIDCLAQRTNSTYLLRDFECTYGPFRWLLINNTEKFQVPILRVWTSVFAFVWILAHDSNMSEPDTRAICTDIMRITGHSEFQLFACICMCFHRMFGLLPYNMCRVLLLFI